MVGLVEHGDLDRAEVAVTLADQVLEASGAGQDDVDAAAQTLYLRVLADAAEDGLGGQAGGLGQRLEGLAGSGRPARGSEPGSGHADAWRPRLFAEARKARPAIIFIDEIDAVGGVRGSDNNSEREQTLNQLLVEMDGFNSTGDLVVIAASNLLEKLDPALLRPGRFDRQIFVSPPDVAGREAILKVHTRGKPLSADFDLALIARQTSGLTGADLGEHLQRGGDLRCARSAGARSCTADFDSALERVVAGMQSRRTLNDHERRVVALHEAGHALCAELLPGVDRVHKISIVPGQCARLHAQPARGGPLPQDARGAHRLHDDAARRARGRGDRLRRDHHRRLRRPLRVAEISRSMIHEYAMGTTITSRKVSAQGGLVSDRTRELRDDEQQHLTDEAKRAATRMILEHRDKLDQMAAALLRNEVLERNDIDRIMGGTPRFQRSPGRA